MITLATLCTGFNIFFSFAFRGWTVDETG